MLLFFSTSKNKNDSNLNKNKVIAEFEAQIKNIKIFPVVSFKM